MKRQNRTTAKHFKLFKKEVRLWLDRLGLKDWRVDFDHEDIGDGSGVSTRAWYHGTIEDRVCGIGLAKNWDSDPITNRKIRECAFHEVGHVLLAQLEGIAERRQFIRSELAQELHVVIRRFENYFYGTGEAQKKV